MFHMSPFELRRERFSEFCLLVKRLKKYQATDKARPISKDGNGKKKTYIPVTDYKPV